MRQTGQTDTHGPEIPSSRRHIFEKHPQLSRVIDDEFAAGWDKHGSV